MNENTKIFKNLRFVIKNIVKIEEFLNENSEETENKN